LQKNIFLTVEYNISRLYYLLDLFKMSIDDLLLTINLGRKTPIVKDELLTEEIKLSYLKKIDLVFNKGINFYLDPKAPDKSKESSIFFRKENFNSELNLGSRKIVTHFEEFKISFSAIAKLSDVNLKRKIPVFSINNSPKQVAEIARKKLYPDFSENRRDFLKALISKLAEENILVSEFVETWNKKERANIDGFFLAPNVIVLKRQQTKMRREIFTFAHELGHYMLNEEEIESLDFDDLISKNESATEHWCNDFAFYFLAGEYAEEIENLGIANSTNDYHFELIGDLSNKTHLSRLALYTRLLLNKKISHHNYLHVKQELDEQFRKKEAALLKQKELDLLKGIKANGRPPKPIQSPLLISTLQTAYYEGIVNEYYVCKTLNITADKFQNYIQ